MERIVWTHQDFDDDIVDEIFGGCDVCSMGYLVDGIFGGWDIW